MERSSSSSEHDTDAADDQPGHIPVEATNSRTRALDLVGAEYPRHRSSDYLPGNRGHDPAWIGRVGRLPAARASIANGFVRMPWASGGTVPRWSRT